MNQTPDKPDNNALKQPATRPASAVPPVTASDTSSPAGQTPPATSTAATAAESASAPDKPATGTPKLDRPKRMTVVLMALLFALGTAIVLWVWGLLPFGAQVEQTDNSYVRGNSTVLSSQINGYVDQVLVRDFDEVKKGQLLLRINAANYSQQIVQAESGVTQAKTNLANQKQVIAQRQADIKVAETRIVQAQNQYDLSRKQLNRLQQLVGMGAVSKAEVDTAAANVRNNEANLNQARASKEAAEQALKTAEVAQTGLEAQVKSASAQVDQARTINNYSEVVAPVSGQLGQVNIRTGQYVSTGTQLVYIIPHETWVIANFKETQLKNLHLGQPAEVHIDALGDRAFKGHITSISPATGSEFSVIKTDNATGNFTKVVQRISVRIDLDPGQAGAEQLRPGMSAVTRVNTAS